LERRVFVCRSSRRAAELSLFFLVSEINQWK
jgi:hypothetical protein